MKNAIVALFTFCLLLSCSREYREAMDIAQSQMMSAPDSSLAILQGMDGHALSTRGLRARYALLLTMARDKCYMDVSQDTTIRVAYDWYQHHGSKQERMLSAYYMGVVQQQAGNSIEAILAFREAEPLAEELADYRQLSLTEQHLSEIYYNNYDDGRALDFAQEALRFAELAEEPVMADYCRYDVAVRLLSKFHYEKAEVLLSEVLANNKNNLSLYSFAAQKMAEVCFFKNNPDIELARKYYREIEEIGILPFGCHDYGIQAGLCEYEHESTAADNYLKKAESLVSTSVDSILFYNDCRNVYDKRGDWKRAHDFKTKSADIQNRVVFQILGQSLTHTLESYYEDKWELETVKTRNRLYVISLMGIILIVLVGLVLYVVNKRNRAVLEDMARTQDFSNELMNTLISDKIQGLQQLSESYFSWDDDSVKKREEKNGRFSRDEIIASFRSQLNKLRKDHSFVATLEQSLDLSENGIMESVRRVLPDEKELDYAILTLLFSGFSIKSISFLFRMSEASLRMRKTRYKQRFNSLSGRERSLFLEKLG